MRSRPLVKPLQRMVVHPHRRPPRLRSLHTIPYHTMPPKLDRVEEVVGTLARYLHSRLCHGEPFEHVRDRGMNATQMVAGWLWSLVHARSTTEIAHIVPELMPHADATPHPVALFLLWQHRTNDIVGFVEEGLVEVATALGIAHLVQLHHLCTRYFIQIRCQKHSCLECVFPISFHRFFHQRVPEPSLVAPVRPTFWLIAKSRRGPLIHQTNNLVFEVCKSDFVKKYGLLVSSLCVMRLPDDELVDDRIQFPQSHFECI
mmetsp:Transcript_62798/g.148718  ORF Transcript_62798/g.148718 Transcript_62798/m.148718 type:complete len:259 (-) Transcript_62798:512-1288(-)